VLIEHAKHKDFKSGLNNVTGLVSHIMVYLQALGWKPEAFNQWTDPEGNILFINVLNYTPCSLTTLIHSLIDSFHTGQNLLMSKHYGSESITSEVICNLTLQKASP